MEGFEINPDHKKPFYRVDCRTYDMYVRQSLDELNIQINRSDVSNKVKKHFGFVFMSKWAEAGNGHRLYIDFRIEIHDVRKLFAFRLKHGI